MSKMIPSATVDVLRNNNDISVDIYGIACTLYIPTNMDTVENLDAYEQPDSYEYTEYTDQLVVLLWSPNTKQLRKLGVFTEDDIPLLCWFKNSPEVINRSYIKIPLQYIPKEYDTDEFTVAETIIRGMHDKVALKCYKAVPRRTKEGGE
jgi:hypothetical protein